MRALPIGGAFFWLTTANGLDPPLEDRRAFPKLHPSPPTAAALGQQRSAIGQRNQSPAPSWASDSAIATVAAWSPHPTAARASPAPLCLCGGCIRLLTSAHSFAEAFG